MAKLFLAATIAAALTISACSHNHEHDDHADSITLTAYSDSLELLAETSPLVTGEKAEIAAHLTSLSSFKPFEAEKVTLTLTVSSKTVEATPVHSHQSGIYRFELTPGAEGNGNLLFTIITNSRTIKMQTPVTIYANGEEAEHAAHSAVPSTANTVPFPKEMSWKVDFSTVIASTRNFGEIIRTMAQVEPSQGDVRTISAKTAGIVSFTNPSLTDGATVSAGQTLFSIDASSNPDNNLRVRVQEAENNYNAAKRDYELKQQLRAENLATESDLRQAKNTYENARANYSALRNGFGNGNAAISTPIAGYITGINVSNGQYVEAGQTLATVGQNRDIYLKAEVSPSFFSVLPDITDATIITSSGAETLTLKQLDGQVVSFGKTVDAQNPLIPVVFRVKNAPGLIPGTFVEMNIEAGASVPAMAVPSESVIEEMGNFFVYRQVNPELFEKTEVKIGKSNGIYTEILSGISQNDRIVARGAILVKLAHSAGTLDAHSGHVH